METWAWILIGAAVFFLGVLGTSIVKGDSKWKKTPDEQKEAE